MPVAVKEACLRPSCLEHRPFSPVLHPATSSCSSASSSLASVAAFVASLGCSATRAHRLLASSFTACVAASSTSTASFAFAAGLRRHLHLKASYLVQAGLVATTKPSFSGMDRSCSSFDVALVEARIHFGLA